MDKKELEKRFEVAHKVIHDATVFLLSHREMRNNIEQKGKNDYVTMADKECERIIESEIIRLFPNDALFGEENGEIGESRNRWIIDPIDGTVDFMTGYPNYTISIAFEDDEGLAFGLVMVVAQNELFSAFRGEGSYLNGVRIHTDETTDPSKQLVIMVPPHRQHEDMAYFMPRFVSLYDLFSDMRSLGSAACSMCYVASGRVQAYYEINLHLYDIAAGVVILNEAGGKVTLKEKDGVWLDVIASSSFVHERLKRVVE